MPYAEFDIVWSGSMKHVTLCGEVPQRLDHAWRMHELRYSYGNVCSTDDRRLADHAKSQTRDTSRTRPCTLCRQFFVPNARIQRYCSKRCAVTARHRQEQIRSRRRRVS
jgi:hypothetical protein